MVVGGERFFVDGFPVWEPLLTWRKWAADGGLYNYDSYDYYYCYLYYCYYD